MKKAIKINNEIKVFTQLPKTWKNHMNFRMASVELQEQEGFYDYYEPLEYDNTLQYLGDIVWDENNRRYTRPIVNRSEEELNQITLKEKERHAKDLHTVIREISQIVSDVKNIYDPLRTASENIPQGFKDLVNMVQPLRDRAYSEIEALSTAEEALSYKIRGPEVIGYIDQLKSFL